MPMMYSGTLVDSRLRGVPTLLDIGLSLSRLTRFAGHTQRWFSVLDHSLFVEQLAIEDGYEAEPGLRLACLLHDAHECITSDVPSDVKPSSMRVDQQDILDPAIMNAHFPGGIDAYEHLCGLIKEFDRRALVTEAFMIGPPICRSFRPAAWLRYFNSEKPTNRDVTFLDRLLRGERLSRPSVLHLGADAPNARAFVQSCKDHASALRTRLTGNAVVLDNVS